MIKVTEVDTSSLTQLGQKVLSSNGNIETFELPEGHNLQCVKLVSNEIYCTCPVTGQPDFYSIAVSYKPRVKCLESKSVKLYFHALKESAIFGEALADRICGDFLAAAESVYMSVVLTQSPRGGISIVSTSVKNGVDDGTD